MSVLIILSVLSTVWQYLIIPAGFVLQLALQAWYLSKYFLEWEDLALVPAADVVREDALAPEGVSEAIDRRHQRVVSFLHPDLVDGGVRYSIRRERDLHRVRHLDDAKHKIAALPQPNCSVGILICLSKKPAAGFGFNQDISFDCTANYTLIEKVLNLMINTFRLDLNVFECFVCAAVDLFHSFFSMKVRLPVLPVGCCNGATSWRSIVVLTFLHLFVIDLRCFLTDLRLSYPRTPYRSPRLRPIGKYYCRSVWCHRFWCQLVIRRRFPSRFGTIKMA